MLKKPISQRIPPVLVFFLLILSGCGNPTPAATHPAGQAPSQVTAQSGELQPSTQASTGTKIDACTLLTKADAEQILGNAVDEPTHPIEGSQIFNVDSCEYKLTGATGLESATLIMTQPANGDLVSAQTAFETGKQQAESAYNASPVDIPGLGDTAYWVAGAGNNLSIMKGDINITLSVSTQQGNMPTQSLIDLAKLVLSRLP